MAGLGLNSELAMSFGDPFLRLRTFLLRMWVGFFSAEGSYEPFELLALKLLLWGLLILNLMAFL